MINTYPNPLDNFRSYSIQYVMMLTSSTKAVADMLGTTEQPTPLISLALQANSPGESVNVNGTNAYLILDTRRFSQYSISSINMEHMYGTGTINNPTVPVSTAKVNVMDTVGSFFTMLMTLFREKLQSTRASSFFVLSIIFVGHRSDGTTETISTCNIPLTLLLMGFTTDERGSEYEIEFMELEGAGAAGGPMGSVNYIGNAMTVTTEAEGSTSLVAMINAFERRLNVQSLAYYLKFSNDAEAKSTGGVESTSDGKQYGKLVQYMISIPKDWENFQCDLASTSKSQEQTFTARTMDTDVKTTKATGSTSSSTSGSKKTFAQKSFSSTMTITNAISEILHSSSSVLALSSEAKRKAGTAQLYKIMINVTCDESVYLIHFDVMPYFLPIVADNEHSSQASTATIQPGVNNQAASGQSPIKNLITYDYIFTGKNTQILDLKIKYIPESAVGLDSNIALGGSLLQQRSGAGQKTNDIQAASTSAAKSSSYSPNIRSGDPIFIPFMTRDQMNGNVGQSNEDMAPDDARDKLRAKQEMTQTFAYLHFISSIGLDMTIRGNPNIIRKYADRNVRGGVPPHTLTISVPDIRSVNTTSSNFRPSDWYNKTLAQKVSSGKQEYYSKYIQPRIDGYSKTGQVADTLIDGPDVSVQPLFCKINIKSPYSDWAGNYLNGQQIFSDRFFYNGPYQILNLTTTISGADFSQTLSLIPYAIQDNLTTDDSTFTGPPPVKSPGTKQTVTGANQSSQVNVQLPKVPTGIIPNSFSGS